MVMGSNIRRSKLTFNKRSKLTFKMVLQKIKQLIKSFRRLKFSSSFLNFDLLKNFTVTDTFIRSKLFITLL